MRRLLPLSAIRSRPLLLRFIEEIKFPPSPADEARVYLAFQRGSVVACLGAARQGMREVFIHRMSEIPLVFGSRSAAGMKEGGEEVVMEVATLEEVRPARARKQPSVHLVCF